MKRPHNLTAPSLAIALLLLLTSSPALLAQPAAPADSNATPGWLLDENDEPLYGWDISGPRIGATFVPPGSKLADELDDEGLAPMLFQFGWHFEWAAVPPSRHGPALLAEFVPLVAGFEQGVIIPSLTFAVGLRSRTGVELGLGPNLSVPGFAMVGTIGKAFAYDGIVIPANLAIAYNPDGVRITALIGYAVDWSNRKQTRSRR